jgi:poly(3-hydroxybutyrate) depolymerase
MSSRLSLQYFTSSLGVLSAVTCLSVGACSGSGSSGVTGAAGSSAGTAGQRPGGTSGAAGTSAGSAGAGTSGGAGMGAAGTQGTAGAAGIGAAGAGGTSEAGAGGASGAAGSTGAAGTNPADGGVGAMPTMGCGMSAGQALGSYVKYSEMITGVDALKAPRNYYVWLPTDYDPQRAYPVVFVGPGCGSNGMQGIPIMTASGNNAIVIGLDPSTHVDPEGRQCFDSQSFPDPEVPYFDQTLALIESKYCVDKSRLFIEGFSSGSWMANLIGCVDAGTIRGQGNASGCLQGIPAGTCTKPIAYMEAHNNPDPNNSYQCGTQNRDEKVKRNGCTTQTMPYTPVGLTVPAGATVSCVQYVGCMKGYPVIFCTTTGLNPQHNPQDNSSTNLTTVSMWNFWTTLESP